MRVFDKKSPYCLEHVGARGVSYYVRYRKRGVRLDKVRLQAENREDALDESVRLILDAKAKMKSEAAQSQPSFNSQTTGLERARSPVTGIPLLHPSKTFKEVAITIRTEGEKRLAIGKLRKRTWDQYKLQFDVHLIPWFEENCPTFDEFLTDPKAKWLQFCEDRWEIDPVFKIYTHRQYASMVFLRAFDNRIIDRKIKLDCPDSETIAGKWVPDADIDKLLLAANPVMRLQIQMGADMGMRRWEILRLRKERIDFDRNVIRLEKEDCKIKKAREFKIPMSVVVALKRHFLTTGDSQYVFPSPVDASRPVSGHKTAWDTTRRKAGVECRFHDLRHTFITNALLVHEISIEKVSQYCGVSAEVIERVYLHNRAEFTAEIADRVDRSKPYRHVLEAVEAG